MAKWCRFTRRASQESGFGKLHQNGTTIEIAHGDLFSNHTLTGAYVGLDEVVLTHPCQPTKFIGLWNNFHALAQQQNQPLPLHPLYFIKASNSYLGHQGIITLPHSSKGEMGRVFYEGELGIVVGKTAKEVPMKNAKDYIFGFTCVNDVTAFEILNQDTSFKQWTRSKSHDTFGPFGPWIETDVSFENLLVKTLVNGRERQSYPCSDMIFNPLQILSHLSFDMTLYPGDVIACGTSLGSLPIKVGQQIDVVIDGVGCLSNTVG